MMTRRAIVLGLALIILVGGKVKTLENAKLWRINHASAETYGLYADDSQRAEWLEVLKLTNDSRPVALLSECEGITVIAPGIFHPPDCSYLVPGHPVPAEIGRKAASIAASRMVVTTREPEWYAKWPELTAALDGCRPVKKSGMFWVLRRERPPSSLLGRETPP